jgi:hypothetical protein
VARYLEWRLKRTLLAAIRHATGLGLLAEGETAMLVTGASVDRLLAEAGR